MRLLINQTVHYIDNFAKRTNYQNVFVQVQINILFIFPRFYLLSSST